MEEHLKGIREDEERDAEKKKSPWLHAWTDGVAGIYSIS